MWDGFRDERRVDVAIPMPEEPPVIRMVLGVLERVFRSEGDGVKSVMFGDDCCGVDWLERDGDGCSLVEVVLDRNEFLCIQMREKHGKRGRKDRYC